ncbi:hypothetical protein [Candidatus Nitrotoga arctica]|uniref:hypothetical protein n=1 Tax=Candidatus Nitrotoga arctica TaxID=453162 RepID=UPI001EFB158E|nr:hypothetical protein [Candidatus Nitrotoga arctica]
MLIAAIFPPWGVFCHFNWLAVSVRFLSWGISRPKPILWGVPGRESTLVSADFFSFERVPIEIECGEGEMLARRGFKGETPSSAGRVKDSTRPVMDSNGCAWDGIEMIVSNIHKTATTLEFKLPGMIYFAFFVSLDFTTYYTSTD